MVIEESNDWEDAANLLDNSFATFATVTGETNNPTTRVILGLDQSRTIDQLQLMIGEVGSAKINRVFVDVFIQGEWIEAAVRDNPGPGGESITFSQQYTTDRIGIRVRVVEPPNFEVISDVKVRLA